jgi:hypothetical protein
MNTDSVNETDVRVLTDTEASEISGGNGVASDVSMSAIRAIKG